MIIMLLMTVVFVLPEPQSIQLHIDGKTDECSKGEDINFQFTGFGVVGKVRRGKVSSLLSDNSKR